MSIANNLKTVNIFFKHIFGGLPKHLYSTNWQGHSEFMKEGYIVDGDMTKEQYVEWQKHNQNNNPVFFALNRSYKNTRQNNDFFQILSLFADYDLKNNEGNIEELEQKIVKYWSEISFCPNMLVRSGNGIHAYWLVKDVPTYKYKEYIEKIISYGYNKGIFADNLKGLNQLLRVPTFYNTKDIHNHKMTYVKFLDTTKYSHRYVKGCLKDIVILDILKDRKKRHKSSSAIKRETINNKVKGESERGNPVLRSFDNLNLSFDNSICSYYDRIVKKYIITYDNFIAYINKLDPKEILGINTSSFRCLFHDDSKPSATFYRGSDNGNWLYYCHAAKCSASHKPLTNLQMISKLIGLSQNETIDKIMDKFNLQIDYSNSAHEIEKATMWSLNIGKLLTGTKYENSIAELQTISNIFIDQLQYNLPKHNNKAPFYLSNEYYGQAIGKSKATANRIFSFAYWLGLINRTSAYKLKGEISQRAIQEKGNRKYFISFFTIPEFNNSTIKQVKAQIRKAKNACLSIADMCANKIIELFGIDEAKRCFNINIEEATKALKKVQFDPIINMPRNRTETMKFRKMFEEIYIDVVARGPTPYIAFNDV